MATIARGRPRNDEAHTAATRYQLTVPIADEMLHDGRLPPEAGQPGERYLTAVEVAELAGVTPYTVRRWVRERSLPAIRLGHSTLRFRRGDVAALQSPGNGAIRSRRSHQPSTSGT